MARINTLLVPLALVVAFSGCTLPAAPEVSVKDLVFLTRGGCVNTTTMRANLDEALGSLSLPIDYQFVDLATLAPSDPRVGYPTPTLLYRNRDLFGMSVPAPPFPEPT